MRRRSIFPRNVKPTFFQAGGNELDVLMLNEVQLRHYTPSATTSLALIE